MSKKIIFSVLALLILIVAFWLLYPLIQDRKPVGQPAVPQSFTTSSSPVFGQSISDGTITISYPSSDFGLAVNQNQLFVHAYIPPCNQGFNFCLYYNASTYQGTNFESAGIAINNLSASLPTTQACLNTPPDGYTNISPTSTISHANYSVSLFANLGNAAVGHYATDNIYRLAYGKQCYEFDARIGETQFANYPAGSIKLFTKSDYNFVESELQSILNTITLPGGEKVILPS